MDLYRRFWQPTAAIAITCGVTILDCHHGGMGRVFCAVCEDRGSLWRRSTRWIVLLSAAAGCLHPCVLFRAARSAAFWALLWAKPRLWRVRFSRILRTLVQRDWSVRGGCCGIAVFFWWGMTGTVIIRLKPFRPGTVSISQDPGQRRLDLHLLTSAGLLNPSDGHAGKKRFHSDGFAPYSRSPATGCPERPYARESGACGRSDANFEKGEAGILFRAPSNP